MCIKTNFKKNNNEDVSNRKFIKVEPIHLAKHCFTFVRILNSQPYNDLGQFLKMKTLNLKIQEQDFAYEATGF